MLHFYCHVYSPETVEMSQDKGDEAANTPLGAGGGTPPAP